MSPTDISKRAIHILIYGPQEVHKFCAFWTLFLPKPKTQLLSKSCVLTEPNAIFLQLFIICAFLAPKSANKRTLILLKVQTNDLTSTSLYADSHSIPAPHCIKHFKGPFHTCIAEHIEICAEILEQILFNYASCVIKSFEDCTAYLKRPKDRAYLIALECIAKCNLHGYCLQRCYGLKDNIY